MINLNDLPDAIKKPEAAGFQDMVNKWYSQVPVKFELVKQTKDHETIFQRGGLTKEGTPYRPIRQIMVQTVKYLDMNIDKYKLIPSCLQIYVSTAYVERMPAFKDPENDFKENFHYKYWRGTDWGIDLDADKSKPEEGFEQTRQHALELVRILRKYEVPYQLAFSGGKGFHFRIPWSEIKLLDFSVCPDCGSDVPHGSWVCEKCSQGRKRPLLLPVRVWEKMYVNIRELFDLDTMDLTIMDDRQYLKALYGVVYPKKSYIVQDEPCVAVPVTDEELKTFHPDDARLSKLLENPMDVRTRSLGMRPGKSEGIRKFVEYFSEV